MVAWLGLIAMGGSMLSGAAGSKAAMEATVEGAQTQAEIERMNRAYQKKVFEEDLARQQPFMEAGKRATGEKIEMTTKKGPLGVTMPSFKVTREGGLADAIKNKIDVTQSPLYQLQLGMMEDPNAPEFVKQRGREMLGAVEGEKMKSRLLDMQQIGLGMAEAAGRSGVNYGTALTSSLARAGGALAQGTQSAAIQQQSMYNRTLDQLSGLPAYFRSTQRSQPAIDMNAQAMLPGGKTSGFTNYELYY